MKSKKKIESQTRTNIAGIETNKNNTKNIATRSTKNIKEQQRTHKREKQEQHQPNIINHETKNNNKTKRKQTTKITQKR